MKNISIGLKKTYRLSCNIYILAVSTFVMKYSINKKKIIIALCVYWSSFLLSSILNTWSTAQACSFLAYGSHIYLQVV